MSPQIGQLASALVKFKQEVPAISLNAKVKIKTKSGHEYSFDYADLPHIDKIVSPALTKNGLVVTQLVQDPGMLTTLLIHESGEYISTQSRMPAGNNIDKQELGSIVTYLRRYALTAILGIIANEDDDANIADGNSLSKAKGKPVAKQSQGMQKVTNPSENVENSAALIPMDEVIMKAMMTAISEGKYVDVTNRMGKYSMTLAQRTTLNTAISGAKNKG
jgi:hypothetical protein